VIARGCGDRTRVHEDDGGELSVRGLGSFSAGKIPRSVADRQAVVRGHVPGAEAGAAKAWLEQGAGL